MWLAPAPKTQLSPCCKKSAACLRMGGVSPKLKRENWNLRGCPRGQCVHRWFGIATPLGTARYRYQYRRGAHWAPEPFRYLGHLTIKSSKHSASFRCGRPMAAPTVMFGRFHIFTAVMVEGPRGCTLTSSVRNALAGRPTARIFRPAASSARLPRPPA